MKCCFEFDRAGLWWSGLGFSIHVYRDARASGEPLVWATPATKRGREFRLGGLCGALSRG